MEKASEEKNSLKRRMEIKKPPMAGGFIFDRVSSG
jgi:hypothetical protein